MSEPALPPSPAAPAAAPAARRRWLHPARLHRLADLAPLAAVLLFLAAIVSTMWYLHMEEVRREKEALKRDVEYAQQRLRQHLTDAQEALMQLARDAGQQLLDDAQFQSRAQAVALQAPSLRAVHWLGADARVQGRWLSSAAPLHGRAAPVRAAAQSMNLLRQRMQPVFALDAPANDYQDATLRLHLPIAPQGTLQGQALAEFSVNALLRHGVPTEVQSKYALALLAPNGQVLAGQSIPDRQGLSLASPWAARINADQSPVHPAGDVLALRAQAWRTSPALVGNTLFWLVAVLAALTAWMLLTNWRQSRHRQQAQRALEVETSFRRAMENSMLTGMRALDMQGRITYVNPAFCQMTGWSEADLLGRAPPFPYWPDEEREKLLNLLRTELSGGADAQGIQLRVKRKDGSCFDARLYVSPMLNAAGQQTGWISSMTDITEPNRVRQQLSAAHARFTTVLEALDASISVAPLGSQELLFANKLYRQWFGHTTEGHLQLLVRGGSPNAYGSAQSADDTDADIDAYAGLPAGELIAAAASSEHPEAYIDALGKWLEVRSRYLSWVDGRLVQMVIATDITARRLAEQKAEEQAIHTQSVSRLITMGEMASSVAHELNQPLTAISNYCTGMITRVRNGAITPDELLGALDKTARQAQRAGQVVQHIRNFVKRSAPQRQWSEAWPMVEQAIELAGIELRRRQVRLTHHVAPGLPALYVDPILIEQVLVNLIKNGAEAITAADRPPAERRVDLRVTACAQDGQPAVCFSVSDTGGGMAPEVLDRLFEAFFSTKPQGLGIGLNLCRSIVEAHQGRMQGVNLYNAGHIAGCRFTFWIPLGLAPSVRATGPSPAPSDPPPSP